MADLTTSKTIQVSVDTGTTYFLTVVIGNGQTGASTFRNPAGKLITPEITNEILDDGGNLKGKSLDIESEVTQINPDTLTLIVSYYVTDHKINNIDNETASGSDTFEAAANDTVSFLTTLEFV